MAIFSKKTEETDQGAEKTSGSATLGKVASDLVGVLVQPRVSEKARKSAVLNKYVFMVRNSANKISVRRAVEGAYKVKVAQVNIVKVSGKKRNFGRIRGKTSNFKKAVVTLRKGESIKGMTETV